MLPTVTAGSRGSDEVADVEVADADDLMTPRKQVGCWNAETPTKPDEEASAAKRQRRFMVYRYQMR